MNTAVPYGPGYWTIDVSPVSFPTDVPQSSRNLGDFTFSAPAFNYITGEGGDMARAQEGPRVNRGYNTYQTSPYQLERGGNVSPFDSRIQRFDGANVQADIIPPNPDEMEPFYYGP